MLSLMESWTDFVDEGGKPMDEAPGKVTALLPPALSNALKFVAPGNANVGDLAKLGELIRSRGAFKPTYLSDGEDMEIETASEGNDDPGDTPMEVETADANDGNRERKRRRRGGAENVVLKNSRAPSGTSPPSRPRTPPVVLMADLSASQIKSGLSRLRDAGMTKEDGQVNLFVWYVGASGGGGQIKSLLQELVDYKDGIGIDSTSRILLLERVPSPTGASLSKEARQAVMDELKVRHMYQESIVIHRWR